MFCPRCGAESDDGSRYCAACGNELPRRAKLDDPKAAESAGLRDRLGRLIGSDRRSRMLSIGTVVAIVVATTAFFALSPADDDSEPAPPDSYAQALEEICVERKRKVGAAQETAVAGASLAAVSRYADSLVPIVGEWRLSLDELAPPVDRVELVDGLDTALLEVEIEAGTLARLAREGNREGVATTAARVDAATANVEAAITALDLRRCARI